MSKPHQHKETSKLAYVVIDQVFTSLVTALTAIVLARTYLKTDYADLVLLFSIAVFILGFQSAVISKPYAINLNDFQQDEVNEYYRFNFLLKLLFTIATIIIFPIIYYLVFNNWNTIQLLLFLTYVLAHTSYFFIRETLLSERKTSQTAAYGLSCSLSICAILLLILFLKLDDIAFYLVSVSLIYVVTCLFYLSNNWGRIGKITRGFNTFWKVNWNEGKWLAGANFLFYLSSGVYPWLLLYLTTKEDIAIYGALMSLGNLATPLSKALSSYLLPLFVKMNKDIRLLNHTVKLWSLLFGVIAFTLISIGFLLGQAIVELLFGEKYNGLEALVIFPFIFQAINIIFQPCRVALYAVKRTDISFWILIPRSLIALGLGYYLVSNYGIIGVFYTMVIENIVHQSLNLFMYKSIVRNK